MRVTDVLLLIASSLVTGCAISATSNSPDCDFITGGRAVCRVSIYTLITRPIEYSGQEVLVKGYVAIDFGKLKLWPTQQAFDMDIDMDSIVIEGSHLELVKLANKSNRKFCSVVGEFRYRPEQEFGIHSAPSEFTKISRIWCHEKRIETDLDWKILTEVDTGT